MGVSLQRQKTRHQVYLSMLMVIFWLVNRSKGQNKDKKKGKF